MTLMYFFFFCELTLDLKWQDEGYEVVPALMLDYIDRKNIAAQFVLLFSIYNRSHQRKRTGSDDETAVSEET